MPKQYSTGGKQRLLDISKRGDSYIRSLLVQGAISAITRSKTRIGRQLIWARELKANKGLQKAAVALANKMTRSEATRAIGPQDLIGPTAGRVSEEVVSVLSVKISHK